MPTETEETPPESLARCASCREDVARSELAACGTCSGCHEDHYFCRGCEACSRDTCGECNQCEACCGCNFCASCSNLVHDDGCCGYCSDHCECETDDDDAGSMRSVREGTTPAHLAVTQVLYGKSGQPYTKINRHHVRDFTCTRMIGVEWEFNNACDLSDWTGTWRGGIHSDGSCGWEAVTPPIAGDNIAKCLGSLGEAFTREQTTSDDKCGIHVHVDAKDLSWHDMYRLLWVYGRLETFLYLLAGQQRASNRYCAPCGSRYRDALAGVDRKGQVLAVSLESHDSGPTPKTVMARKRARDGIDKKDGGRYKGLNIVPWLAGHKAKRPDTTVEFRMHRNTMNPDRVIGWAQLLARLVEWCATHTDADAQALPKSPLRALATIIAPDCAGWIIHRIREWRKSTAFRKRNRNAQGQFTPGGRKFPRRIRVASGAYTFKGDVVAGEF